MFTFKDSVVRPLAEKDFPTFPFALAAAEINPIIYSMSINHSIDENKHYYEITVPGFDKSDIEISMDKERKVINITAKKETKEKTEDEKSGRTIVTSEIKRKISRTITLDDTHDMDSIEAALDKGILTISMPKITPVPPKKDIIEIK